MKRILAICAVVMCLVVSMIPMAFADTLAASSDVRIAGFGYGMSTLNPSSRTSSNEFGGVFVHGDLTVKSVSVTDVQWREDDSTQGGYFFLFYTIDIEPINQADVSGDVVASIPIEWVDGMRVEYSVSTLSDYWTSNTITVQSSSSTHLGVGFTDTQLYGIADNEAYMVELSGTRLLKAYWMPSTADAELTRINISVKVWVPDVTVVTAVSGGTDFGSWLTYPFRLVAAGGGVILAFFSTIMNVALVAPIIGITGCALLMSVIISIVR